MIEVISRLPAGYQEVKYIESNGTQCINSRVPLTTNLGVKAKFKILSNTPELPTFFGVHDTASPPSYFAVRGYNNELHAEWSDQYTVIANNLSVPFDCEIEFNYLNSGKVVLNGVDCGNVAINRGLNYTLYIFATMLNGSVQRFSKMQLESFVITNGQTVIRDYVPSYREADKAGGLYDLVDDVFDANVGSGNFIVGASLPNVKITAGGIIPQKHALRRRTMASGGRINLPPVGTPLADWTWEQIIALANSGQDPQNYFAIGDEKDLILTTGEVVPVVIGDFYHNPITGTDTLAPFAFLFKNCLNTKYTMNGTNRGGWPASQMRNSIVPGILSTFPAELTANNAIKYVDVVSCIGDGSTSLTTSSDRLRMLSVTELGTSRTGSVRTEGTKYAYYTSSARRKKKVGTKYSAYYTRTPLGIDGSDGIFSHLSMITISASGGSDQAYANTSLGVSFAFDI